MADGRKPLALTLAALTCLLGASGPAAAQAPPLVSNSPCRDPDQKPGEADIDEHLIYFDHGSAELPKREWVNTVLRSAVCWANQGATSVRIIARADASGEAAYNQALSERRGRRVATELIRRGLKPSLIVVEAWGESRPAVATEDGVPEALNRVVVITHRLF